jgi:hypothetical protein
LPLTTGQFARFQIGLIPSQPNGMKQLFHPILAIAGLADPMNDEGLRNDLSDGHTPIHCCQWILVNHLHLRPQGAPWCSIGLRKREAIENYVPFVRPFETETDAGHRRFARPGFTNNAERAAALEHEAHIVHGREGLAPTEHTR